LTYVYVDRTQSSLSQLIIDLGKARQAVHLDPELQRREINEIAEQIDRRCMPLVPAQLPPPLSVWARGYRAT
jgi:hypothetical protein